MQERKPRGFWRDDRGAVAATYALSLVALIAVAGVGMDYARMSGMDSELQNGADQAALAAATQLDGKAGACSRASAAAVNLVSNLTLLASGANAVTVPSEPACDAVGQIRFYQDKNRATPATSDANANYVQVIVDARTVDYALIPITGMVMSGSIQGIAFAGLGSAICKLPPIMMCNPRETTGDFDFDIDFYIGKGIRLVANDGGGYTPGNFGYLDTEYGSGAIATARVLGRTEIDGDCVATDGVTTKPGEQISVLDALNTRYGIYANGLNAVCNNDGSLCPPSANGRIDLIKKGGGGGNCSISNAGFQEGPNPYRPNSAAPLDAATIGTLQPMGYPRDMCHAWSKTGDCPFDRVGTGVWDQNAYLMTNQHIYPGGTLPGGVTWSDWGPSPPPATGVTTPTRYQLYRYEYFNGKMASANWPGGFTAQGTPLCNPPGIALPPVSSGVDRRVLSIAVINCLDQGVVGKTPNVDPVDWVDVFLVEPSARRGKGVTTIVEKSDVYVEVIGPTTLGGGATQGQEIRKDVPYLIE